MKRRAFTLVEILIVLGIITVLVGFLLVVTRKGGDSARAAICLNNLRQLAAGLTGYAQDHEGKFPPKEAWADEMARKYATALACPADDVSERPAPATQPYRYSYTINALVPPVRPVAVTAPAAKVLLIEQNQATASLPWFDPDPASDALSLRHDPQRGNVAFVDGHAAPLPLTDFRRPEHYDPRLP